MNNNISMLLGRTLTNIIYDVKGQELIFHCLGPDRVKFRMYHNQDCCEDVYLDDIGGDLKNLLHEPILKAEESTNKNSPKSESDISWTWTFYQLATINGYVTLRWYGSSNGYYSEDVNFEKVEE